MRALVLVVAILAVPVRAHAEPRCVGWAVPGALIGPILVGWTTFGTMKLAGMDLNAPANQGRVMAAVAGSMVVGATAGPIATCRALSHERHAIPAASFVVLGGSLGALAVGGAFVAGVPDRCVPSRTNMCEGYVPLVGLVAALGAVAGGFGGYYLHRAAFRERAMIAPIVAPGAAGLAIGGRF